MIWWRGSVWKSYTSDALNQYSEADALPVTNGPGEHRISAFDGVTFTYTNDGRLAMLFNGTTWTTFAYDALGRCVKRVRDNWDAKYSYYDGERELLECGSGGGAAFKNLYGKGIDEILRRKDTTKNWTFYHQQDQNGNVTELTNGSGVVVETFQYDAFGLLNKTASGWGNPFLFTGRRYQSTFGIYEYRARAYHPRLGRFTSEDPKLFDAGDYNLFRYCHNDPVDMTDPMGLSAFEPSGADRHIVTGSHIPVSDKDLSGARDLAGLSTTYGQAFQSAYGLTMRHTKAGGGSFFSRLFDSIGKLFGHRPRRGAPDGGGDSAIERAMNVPGTNEGSRKDTERGALYITHYGYPTDPAGDARRVNRVGNHDNTLNKDSLALSEDLRRRFEQGARVYLNGRYLGNYDDSAPYKRGVIDVFDPTGRAGGEEYGRTIERGNYILSSAPGP